VRVEFNTVEDFANDLATEAAAGRVYENIVRVRVDREPEQREAISHLVGFWATAVVRSESGDWLLEFGQVAGSDTRMTPDGGTAVAERWRKRIEAVAKEYGLAVRSGRIEVW
jgi:hypothetical protein